MQVVVLANTPDFPLGIVSECVDFTISIQPASCFNPNCTWIGKENLLAILHSSLLRLVLSRVTFSSLLAAYAPHRLELLLQRPRPPPSSLRNQLAFGGAGLVVVRRDQPRPLVELPLAGGTGLAAGLRS